MEELFRDMQLKGLISCGDWLQRAIEQRSHNLTLGLADSRRLPMIQDSLSEVMCLVLPFETKLEFTTLNSN